MDSINRVFIACSLDGFIADVHGGIDWLNTIPNPEQKDLGYLAFMKDVDALLMGRKTYEKVISFNIPWPYEKPVFVWTSKLNELPLELHGKVEFVKGDPDKLLEWINSKGFYKLYIDGGSTIQAFLAEDKIDEMIISRIPVVLGGGYPLFGSLPQMLQFSLKKSEVFLNEIVQDTYIRKNSHNRTSNE